MPGTHPGGVLGLIFAGYVPLASQNRYPIIVNSVAKHGPHLSHFWEKCNFRNPNLQNNLILQKKMSGVDKVVNLRTFQDSVPNKEITYFSRT